MINSMLDEGLKKSSHGSPNKTLSRVITSPKRGSDNLFVQPREVGPDREMVEQHNRDRAAAKADYADPFTGNARTFDISGNYRCGDCNQEHESDCELVQVDPVDVGAGSCGKFEVKCAGDPEIHLKRLTVITAGYAIAKNGVGFGCHRCPLGSPAYQADSQGRNIYCGEWEARVFWNACCNSNSTPEVKLDSKGQPAK